VAASPYQTNALAPLSHRLRHRPPKHALVFDDGVDMRLRRYRLSYWGTLVGSYATAKETLEGYREYEKIRPIIAPKKQGRYIIRDRNKEITLRDLKRAADKE
jgi:hypothetical protein